jgi:alginate O-acetyltransferase complex protein AlgI
MLFNSLTFIVFFVVVLGLYYAVRPWGLRKSILLIASYLFYAAWNPPFVLLLWISTLVDWFAARRLEAETVRARRIGWLLLSLATNLGILGFFKYGGFFLDSFVSVVGFYGVSYQAAKPDIVLPVGISFYTFQTLSYTLDVYRRRSKPAKSFLDFALYVTFFPQLVAGPIVRATQFIPQCVTPKWPSLNQIAWGMFLMTLGLFQKVVLADAMLAPAAEAVFGFDRGPLHPFDAWLGVLAFSGQIFFDFAGYSTTAIGTALCFGFSLPDNFRCPYAAVGFSDFWQRWHISLSSWLRDYLYIPLGGNRAGALRTVFNLMVTMLLGGLWHGASWTFVVWGGIHGIYLVIERGLKRLFAGRVAVEGLAPKLLLGLITYFLVNITWVFFRAPDFPSAGLLLASMFGLPGEGAQVLPTLDVLKVVVVIAALLIFQWAFRGKRTEEAAETVPWWMHALAWAAMIVVLVITQGTDNAFIYFQF